MKYSSLTYLGILYEDEKELVNARLHNTLLKTGLVLWYLEYKYHVDCIIIISVMKAIYGCRFNIEKAINIVCLDALTT